MSVQLGDKVRDRISGFVGIAVCRAEWLFGCVRIGVQSAQLDKDSKPIEAQHFDEDSLEVVFPQNVQSKQRATATGGPAREGSGFARRDDR